MGDVPFPFPKGDNRELEDERWTLTWELFRILFDERMGGIPLTTTGETSITPYFDIWFVIDGTGGVPDTGWYSACVIDFPCEILSATILAEPEDTDGSIQFDICKISYGLYETIARANHSICGGNYPTVSSGAKAYDNNLVGWTTEISAGEILAPYVISVSGLNKASLTLELRKTE